IVLGHFFFVYIHPYSDGNGRMGRFLMNLMMAAGGYSWTVVPVERRTEYMDALEAASVRRDIVPFTRFLAGIIGGWTGGGLPLIVARLGSHAERENERNWYFMPGLLR